jgi:hypothetical protein
MKAKHAAQALPVNAIIDAGPAQHFSSPSSSSRRKQQKSSMIFVFFFLRLIENHKFPGGVIRSAVFPSKLKPHNSNFPSQATARVIIWPEFNSC